jgi:hypothetical protein
VSPSRAATFARCQGKSFSRSARALSPAARHTGERAVPATPKWLPPATTSRFELGEVRGNAPSWRTSVKPFHTRPNCKVILLDKIYRQSKAIFKFTIARMVAVSSEPLAHSYVGIQPGSIRAELLPGRPELPHAIIADFADTLGVGIARGDSGELGMELRILGRDPAEYNGASHALGI